MKSKFSTFWRFKGIVILSLILLNVLLSCKKEEYKSLVNDQSVNDRITFLDGRLVFKDVESFKDHQKWLFENQSRPQLIAEKNRSIGFKSMTEYYLEGMKLEENDPKFIDYVAEYPSIFNKEICDKSTLYVLPHSILLCYVINEDGIFQVGDYIYRIVPNYLYRVGNESKIGMLLLPKDQILDKEVDISITRPELESKNDLAQRTEYFDNDSRFRIVSSVMEFVIIDEHIGPVWWYDIRTNPQKRTLGIWLRAQLNTKSARGNGYWYFPNHGVQYLIDASHDELTGVTQQNIVFCGGSAIDLNASYCPAYSRGRLKDGYTQWIYIEWHNALTNSPTYT